MLKIAKKQAPELSADDIATSDRKIVGNIDAMLVFNEQETQCQRSFQIKGFVYSDDTLPQINWTADMARKVLERQFLQHDLKRLHRNRENQITSMKNWRDKLKEIAERRASPKREHGRSNAPTAKEIDELDNGQRTMEQAQKILDDWERQIADREAEIIAIGVPTPRPEPFSAKP